MPYTSINRVTLVGNLTHDPELRELPSGRRVCHLRVACTSRRRTDDGDYEAKPNYFDVSVFGPPGESAHRYLQKGSPVAVDGRLEWSSWEGVDGKRRQAVGIVASEVQFLRGRGAEAEGALGRSPEDPLAGDKSGAESRAVQVPA
ncbi:MAG TPA: single-stranded DNA-binding protein [Solirubrobacteraceae bacterium]|nr:single-stranded DNA-binding protein [Solirubrobacteraceae bacterium]